MLLNLFLQNVSPAHVPDVVIFVDAIAVVFEEASQGGLPLSLPIACIDAGNDHCLPNLPLRFLSPQKISNFGHCLLPMLWNFRD